ncbi:MAG: hypothetical protein LIO41_05285 [Ruminococcus sp.]|nr:hypothetical protein [Ruminococcus sp.]
MKKFIITLIIAASLMLCLCACKTENDSSTESSDSSSETETVTEDSEITEDVTETSETKEVTETSETEEIEMATFEAQTPGNETFDISADDIWLYKCTGPNPTDPRLEEITDADVKVKIYNMVRNIIECEPVVYEDPSLIPSGATTWKADIKLTDGNWYRVYMGAAASGDENFAVMWYQDGETLNESFALDGEYVAEFYDLLGLEHN